MKNLACKFFSVFPEMALNRGRIHVNIYDYFQVGQDAYLGITAFSARKRWYSADDIPISENAAKLIKQYHRKPKKVEILNNGIIKMSFNELFCRTFIFERILAEAERDNPIRYKYYKALCDIIPIDYSKAFQEAGYDDNLSGLYNIVEDMKLGNFVVITLYGKYVMVDISTPSSIKKAFTEGKQKLIIASRCFYDRFRLLFDIHNNGDCSLEDVYRMVYAISSINEIPILLIKDGIVYTEYFYEQLRKINEKKFDKAFRKSVILSL